MQSLFELGDGFECHTEGEILRIEAWGPHAIRVRSAATSIASTHPGPRVHAARGDGSYRLELSFEAYDDERVYGLGQHLHGRLDQKGA